MAGKSQKTIESDFKSTKNMKADADDVTLPDLDQVHVDVINVTAEQHLGECKTAHVILTLNKFKEMEMYLNWHDNDQSGEIDHN